MCEYGKLYKGCNVKDKSAEMTISEDEGEIRENELSHQEEDWQFDGQRWW